MRPLRKITPRVLRFGTLTSNALAAILLFLVSCSQEPPADVLHLLPDGLIEGPLMSGDVTRMGFAAPVGGLYRMRFAIPETGGQLTLAFTMLPDSPCGPTTEAEFMAELVSAEGDSHLILESPAGPDSWQEAVIDLSPFSGQQMKLILRSRPVVDATCGYACWATPFVVTAGTSPPNVLIISIDALRADHLSCYGYERTTSPTLDSLAAQGVLFESVASQAPWTLPAHASLFTAHYMKTHGITDWQQTLAPDALMLAEVLRRGRYVTGAVIGGALPARRGFSQGFDSYDAGCFHRAAEDPVTNTCTNEKAVAWLRRHAHVPFFLFLHYWDVHDPYMPPSPYDRLFDPDYQGSIIPWETLYGWRALRQKTPGGARGLKPRDLAHIVALYDGEIAHTDRSLSRLFAELRRLQLDRRTLVIVTSDHGDEFLEHGRTGHGKTLFSELIHVPLIWVDPAGRQRGVRIKATVQTVDIMPSILDFLAIPQPPTEGVSFAPLLRGEHVKQRSAFSEAVGFSPGEGSQYAAISGSTKVILSTQSGVMKAYDLKADPMEQHPKDLDDIPTAAGLGAVLDSFIESATLEIRVTGLGNRGEHLVSLTAVPPLSIRSLELEGEDSLAYSRYTRTLSLLFDCPLGDVDGVTVELPLTAHVHELAGTYQGRPLPAHLVRLGDGGSPDSMPYRFRDRDPRLQRSSPEIRTGLANEPGVYLWRSSRSSLFSEPAEQNTELEQRLRALGYLQ